MKKSPTIYTFLFALLAFTVNTHASFPVKKKTKTVEVVKNNSVEKVEVASYSVPARSGQSQIVAAILCWVVGVIGVHRFYLGYTWQGIVQILTLGGLGIWTLIDFIRILTGSLQPKNGRYAKTI